MWAMMAKTGFSSMAAQPMPVGKRNSHEWHSDFFNPIPRNKIDKRRPPWDKDR
jgi:hypothetical protein